MKYRFLMGLFLIAGMMFIGCDANRGKPVVDNAGSGEADNPLAKYDNFEVSYPEAFDGEFNPEGLEVGPEVGKLAPEIEGVDLEGTEFKLSDYRGKVVMLDFYGDW